MNHSLKEIIYWKTYITVFVLLELITICWTVLIYMLPVQSDDFVTFFKFIFLFLLHPFCIGGIITSILKYKSKKFYFIELLIYEPTYREANNIKIIEREIYINNKNVSFKQALLYLLPKYPFKINGIQNRTSVLLKTRFIFLYFFQFLIWAFPIFILTIMFINIHHINNGLNTFLDTKQMLYHPSKLSLLILLAYFFNFMSLWIPPSWALTKSFLKVSREEKRQRKINNVKITDPVTNYLKAWKQVQNENSVEIEGETNE